MLGIGGCEEVKSFIFGQFFAKTHRLATVHTLQTTDRRTCSISATVSTVGEKWAYVHVW